jgi:hypothetical protein
MNRTTVQDWNWISIAELAGQARPLRLKPLADFVRYSAAATGNILDNPAKVGFNDSLNGLLHLHTSILE